VGWTWQNDVLFDLWRLYWLHYSETGYVVIYLYGRNGPIDRAASNVADYDVYTDAYWPMGAIPEEWVNDPIEDGAWKITGPQLAFEPQYDFTVAGWLLADFAAGDVLVGDVIFAPRKKIVAGDLLLFQPSTKLSDHGPPCS
jgi:hypothetical protein